MAGDTLAYSTVATAACFLVLQLLAFFKKQQHPWICCQMGVQSLLRGCIG